MRARTSTIVRVSPKLTDNSLYDSTNRLTENGALSPLHKLCFHIPCPALLNVFRVYDQKNRRERSVITNETVHLSSEEKKH